MNQKLGRKSVQLNKAFLPHKHFHAAEIYQRSWLENSGQFDNVDRTHLASTTKSQKEANWPITTG